MKFHLCNTRRNVYGTLIAAAAIGVGSLAFLPREAAAEEQNPIKEDRPAPELVGTNWVNRSGQGPFKLAARAGKVTIVHFWTFGCINCKHNLPAYNELQKKFASRDVAFIGIHTPETPGEAVPSRVRSNVRRWNIAYPILVDDHQANWNRWNNQFWPEIYLVDKHGRIRYRWEGELEFDNQDGTRKITELVNKLLAEK